MTDFSSKNIEGIRRELGRRFKQGYNVTFGNIPERRPGLETSTDSSSVVYGGSSRPARVGGIPLQVNRGVVLALGEMRIHDEHLRNPGVYSVLDAAGMVHPMLSYDFSYDNPIKRNPRDFLARCTNNQTQALIELRGMYETTYEAHDFLPGMLEAMVETWNMGRPLPLLVLPCEYRVERNITEATALECVLKSVKPLHKAVKKKGWNPLAQPDMISIGTRAVAVKHQFNTDGEWRGSGMLERDFLTRGYNEGDVHEPRRAADVSLI
ncbi:MAG TPA: hypothetical protein VI933_04910 [archaeon]|nr:hypothetical protein [archaeon]